MDYQMVPLSSVLSKQWIMNLGSTLLKSWPRAISFNSSQTLLLCRYPKENILILLWNIFTKTGNRGISQPQLGPIINILSSWSQPNIIKIISKLSFSFPAFSHFQSKIIHLIRKMYRMQGYSKTRWKVLKVTTSWAKDERWTKLIDEKGWLGRKLINGKVDLWESWLMRKLLDEKVNWWNCWWPLMTLWYFVWLMKGFDDIWMYGQTILQGVPQKSGIYCYCYK